MANDERNFRSSYYEKVGCRSVEEKKSLEILLKETPKWDKGKLKQFSLRFTVPATYRLILWKVQMGMLPYFPNSHEFCLAQRTAQYNDLLHAITVMRIIDANTTKAHTILIMYLLENGQLHYDFNYQFDNNKVAVCEALVNMYDDDVDVYWLSKGFYRFVDQLLEEVPKMIECAKILLEKEDSDLHKYLQDKDALDGIPMEKWFSRLFAGELDESALIKVWDKVCGGSSAILVFVAVTILVTLRRNLMKCKDLEQILKCLQDIPEETEEIIANKSIELWQHYGSFLHVQTDTILSKGKPDIMYLR